MKKIIALFLAIFCAMSLLAGCGASKEAPAEESAPAVETPAPEAPAETPEAPAETPEAAPAGPDWAVVDSDPGILTVTLPLEEDSYYAWDMEVSDEAVAEMLTCSTETGDFTASFRGLAEGECTLTFRCQFLHSVPEIRTLTLRVEGDKIAEILSWDEKVLGEKQDFPGSAEVLQMRNSNTISNIMKQHQFMTVVSESWHMEEGAEVWDTKLVQQYSLTNGRLWYEAETYGTEVEPTFVEAFYINDDVPGTYLAAVPGTYRSMNVYPADEYTNYLGALWLFRADGAEETLVSLDTNEEYGTIVMLTEIASDADICNSYEYYLDAETGLITGMTHSVCEAGTNEIVNITRSNIFYDEPRLMETRAASEVLFPEDACYLTVVINPGEADEETQNFQIAKDTVVDFVSIRPFEMFYDYECTQPMDLIDANQNKASVYVKLER